MLVYVGRNFRTQAGVHLIECVLLIWGMFAFAELPTTTLRLEMRCIERRHFPSFRS